MADTAFSDKGVAGIPSGLRPWGEAPLADHGSRYIPVGEEFSRKTVAMPGNLGSYLGSGSVNKMSRLIAAS
jgi:hypothetical protein